MTKKEKRERKKKDRGIVDFMMVSNHFFKHLSEWISGMDDPRDPRYITYTQADLVYMALLKNVCGQHTMREMDENFNLENCIDTLRLMSGNQRLEEMIIAGRGRWKIENEGFNNQKHGVYRIEHLNSKNSNAMKNHYLFTQISDILMQLYLAWNPYVKELNQTIKNTSSWLLESFRRLKVFLTAATRKCRLTVFGILLYNIDACLACLRGFVFACVMFISVWIYYSNNDEVQ